MVMDIDRCQNITGKPPHCANDTELDKWLANHQFNLYSLGNKVNLDLMEGRPVNF